MIPQNTVRVRTTPYTVAAGRPLIPPMLMASSVSAVRAVSWSTDNDLKDALELGLMGADARWLPDTTAITGLTWAPSLGSGYNIALSASYTPYVDPQYVYYARHRKRMTIPAVIFNGAGFAQFTGTGLSGLAAFTLILTAVVNHPNNSSMADIFASPSSATDPVKATDCVLRYDNGYLRTHVGQRTSSYRFHPFHYKGRSRPITMVWSQSNRGGTFGVIDHLQGAAHWHDYAHANKPSYDARFWFGMNGAVQDQAYAQPLDVLDVSLYTRRMDRFEGHRIAHQLDGVYGVTGR